MSRAAASRTGTCGAAPETAFTRFGLYPVSTTRLRKQPVHTASPEARLRRRMLDRISSRCKAQKGR